MSAYRRIERVCLVDSWIDQVLESDYEHVADTGLIQRSLRDSYTHERPLLAASLELRPSIAADLQELGSARDDDGLPSVHACPTLRPTGS